ncbi:nucleotidyltransferase domain-containing protein [Candidatus Gottesmanbacteria bacterium]|nr:nucleotidyltransferase domain-containing protein [Candidatus Gottesmanbacteria bacterium]
MAQKKTVNQDIVRVAQRFANHVQRQGIPVARTVLFGSWAKGKARKDSDIDICLVSPQFGKDDLIEMRYLLMETMAVDSRIEPIPMSTKDYETDATPFVLEIKKYGKIIDI